MDKNMHIFTLRVRNVADQYERSLNSPGAWSNLNHNQQQFLCQEVLTDLYNKTNYCDWTNQMDQIIHKMKQLQL